MIKHTDEEILEAFQKHGSAKAVARFLKIDLRNLVRRKQRMEEKGFVIPTGHVDYHKIERKIDLGILNGSVVVFSDAHFWPGIRTTAFKGLLWAISTLAPKAVIANGDVFDGSSCSTHKSIMWGSGREPSVVEELKACSASMGEIEEIAKAVRHNVHLYWSFGNHDARFSTYLSSHAPMYEKVAGFNLKDHFPSWKPCWSVWLNESVIVKHRNKGGVHATHNNTATSGVSMVTGHLHSLKVTPYTDYNGIRYGVDTGTLADIYGPQFDYVEQNPVNWRSGFAILTFKNGVMLMPELAMVHTKDTIQFRGEVINVKQY